MKTLDLREAAVFLKLHPQTIRRLALAGALPAAKPGKCWVFLEDDLANWLRSRYIPTRQMPQGKEISLWHSTDVKTQPCGGSVLASTDAKYDELLGRPTKGRPRSSKRS